ncbi:hypothetical protein GCM10022280_13400 [Sphingomonas swuensis]|uniref:Uncharacterized protein n=1 Tax=Sphingomonas swuensis TaxID=977800 RepID=A0ABP7SSF6_9SPHN
MARNDDHKTANRTHSGNTTTTNRERRRDRVIDTVKDRPYATAALATVAAGAAAFFLTRGKSDKPLMDWGSKSEGDHKSGASAFKPQGSTSTDGALETGSASPSSSAGIGAGSSGSSPSALQASSLAKSGSSTAASTTGSTGGNSAATTPTGGKGATSSDSGSQTSSPKGNKGLDETATTETKVGAISYGA